MGHFTLMPATDYFPLFLHPTRFHSHLVKVLHKLG